MSSGVGILVQHDDVTVRFNRVNHRDGANGVRVDSSARNVVVEFNDLEGHYRSQPSGNFGSIGVWSKGDSVTVRRNHFRGGRDGIHLYGTNSQAVENWVTDLHRHSGAHNDSIVFGGQAAYANNLIARNRTVAGNSGGIDLYAMYGPIRGVQVVDNLIVGVGKGFGIYGGYVQPLSGPAYHHENRDIRIEGNRFSGEFGWPMTQGEGSNAATNLSQPGNTYANNRWVDGTTDLPARCGTTQDRCAANTSILPVD